MPDDRATEPGNLFGFLRWLSKQPGPVERSRVYAMLGEQRAQALLGDWQKWVMPVGEGQVGLTEKGKSLAQASIG